MTNSILAPGLSRTAWPIGERRETQLGKFSPQVPQRFQFYLQLPYSDPVALLRWKHYVRRRCLTDLEFRAWVAQACEADFAFFIATFGWLMEPRGGAPRLLPFTPFKDQVDIAAWWAECIAAGTLVLTDHGPVPIEDVQQHHRIWDGVEWVEHGGVIFKGYRETIDWGGVRLTPDHKVLTEAGWNEARVGHRPLQIHLPGESIEALQSMEFDARALYESASPLVSQVRRSRDLHLQTVGDIPRVLGGPVIATATSRTEPVYDIRNCGCRRRFCVIGSDGPVVVSNCFGVRNMALVKSRGIGASWLLTWFHLHKWLFVPDVSVGALSMDEDTLESPSAQSMLGRFVWCHDRLPAWMRYTKNGPVLDREKKFRIYRNTNTGASLQGFVSTGQKLRGNRFTALWADEFAFYKPHIQDEWMTAASGTTDSILLCSTWNDFSDFFHHVCYEEESSMLVCSAFWHANEERHRGAYRMRYGTPTLVDKDYQHPDRYDFGRPDIVPEGLLRSPWVDAELSKPDSNALKHLRDIYGMEVCVAGDTPVLTDHGVIRIDEVLPHYRVWDGDDWVNHEGLLFKGVQPTIERLGIHFTPEHKVLAQHGWIKASEIAAEFSRQTVRPPDGYETARAERQPGVGASEKVQKVYDLLNCGPNHRFTVIDGNGEPLLISNCEQENSFFPRPVRDAVEASLSEPVCQGILSVSGGEVKISPTRASDIRIWYDVPNVDRGPYVMGCDLAQGVGQAYSAAVVLDAQGKQVLEYGTRDLKEPEFAANCVAIARWLAGDHGDGWVTIDFETNGQQSKPFSGELLRQNYGNIANSEISGRKKVNFGEVPTYLGSCNRDGGYSNLIELSRAILSMESVVKSSQVYAEMRLFSKDPDKNNQPRFPRMNKLGHGDFTQAFGIAWWRARTTAKPDNVVEGEDDGLRMEVEFQSRRNKLWSSKW